MSLEMLLLGQLVLAVETYNLQFLHSTGEKKGRSLWAKTRHRKLIKNFLSQSNLGRKVHAVGSFTCDCSGNEKSGPGRQWKLSLLMCSIPSHIELISCSVYSSWQQKSHRCISIAIFKLDCVKLWGSWAEQYLHYCEVIFVLLSELKCTVL